jgi:acetyltransferase-like isoleucine patch superfamily enzyme
VVVEDAGDVAFESPPRILSIPQGSGSGTLRLRFGRGVRLGRHMAIEVWARGDSTLEIGDGTVFMNGVRIALRSGSVRLGEKCLVRDGVWIKSDGELIAGAGVTLSHHAAVHCTQRIELGDIVGLGDRVTVLDSNHVFDGSDEHYMLRPLKVEPVRIGRNSMVAVGAVVLPGADIGPNSVVSANSVVIGGEYPAGSLLAGNPSQVVRSLARPSDAAKQTGSAGSARN